MKPNINLLKGLIYIAGPYQHKNGRECSQEEILENIQKAEKASIEWILKGWAVFTPHKNNSGYEKYEKIHDELYSVEWLRRDLELLSRCDAILLLDGWRGSIGSVVEYEFAVKEEMMIFYQDNKENFIENFQRSQNKHQ